MGPDAKILVFLMLSFKSAFSLSPFTLIKRLFSSSSLSAISVVLSAYLRLLIFLSAIWIPACDSSSLAFHMTYSAYHLNKQDCNKQPCCALLPILNLSNFSMSGSNHCFLNCIQVFQDTGKVVWHSQLFKNFTFFCDLLSQRF